MRLQRLCSLILFVAAVVSETAGAQSPPVPIQLQSPQRAQTLAQSQSPLVMVSLDYAIQMALQHNHTLQAARTTIQQSQA